MTGHSALEQAIRYGLTQAKPGTAARILATELDRGRIQRQIESRGGQVWRRTVRVIADDWIPDEQDKQETG